MDDMEKLKDDISAQMSVQYVTIFCAGESATMIIWEGTLFTLLKDTIWESTSIILNVSRHYLTWKK